MSNLFRTSLSALVVALTMSTSLMAWDNYGVNACNPCDPCPCSGNRLYIGGFGGGIYSNSNKAIQMGTAYFPWNDEGGDGPLTVDARGHLKSTSSGFGGVQVGYEWAGCPYTLADWNLTAAAEFETLWYSHKKHGVLFNETDTDRLPEHDFLDSFHLSNTVILGNAIFAIKDVCYSGITPYFGGGIGAAHISLSKADSLQIRPIEAGVNHFNTKRNDTSWAFAAQAKAGIRYNICNSLHIFGEYRYLFIDTSNYILGSTLYPDHVHTSQWDVQLKNINYNAFAFGVQYDL